ncbi:MAG TPA: [FeFe] hydrogenase H-cluster maturation GTPase HydF [Bryobacteraceae bacterium]|nr:[FeFe] hydrogenase H-cluster maturation GTPase HydF [Bryobacteraceae bacterium]
MQPSPKGFRLHIGIFGRRNVGKSTLLNAIVRQQASIVSDIAGTTTDPVEKPMELQPLGPVLFIDTAGIDDPGVLGGLRVEKTRAVLARTDIALIVSDGAWGPFEEGLVSQIQKLGLPAIVVFNKADIAAPDFAAMDRLRLPVVRTVASLGEGIADLRTALAKAVPDEAARSLTIVSDLVGPGELAVLVVPIDQEAPKGRLILPQVQTIRDLLDHNSMCLAVQERELTAALENLRRPPKLVVTDSQAFRTVAADTPADVALTSFSILFARLKGDLAEMACGALAVDRLDSGDRVLICEACTHHPIEEDIGRVKIPHWIGQYTGANVKFTHRQGHDFPDDLAEYSLVIHCGGCMWNRRAMLNRIQQCREAGVPITNYGIVIAHSLGILERALGPFPAVLDAFRSARPSAALAP